MSVAIQLLNDDHFTGSALTPDMVREAEAKLGFKLPSSYLDVLTERNGGVPVRRCFRTDWPTSWAPDHIEIAAVLGIGGEWGIDGTDGLGSADMIAEWGYPKIGIVICAMPSAGHDVVMLDYSACGPAGEPAVVYVDEDRAPRWLAADFARFCDALISCGGRRLSISQR